MTSIDRGLFLDPVQDERPDETPEPLLSDNPRQELRVGGAIAGAQQVLEHTVAFTKEREAFGKPISKFQNTRFKLAEMKTEITIGQTFVDSLVLKANDGTLAPDEACMAKYWTTDLLNKVCYEGLQLHGGAGYMNEYPIARAWRGARVTRIFGGTNEIMKELIGRSL